jgi:hypothetical protein
MRASIARLGILRQRVAAAVAGVAALTMVGAAPAPDAHAAGTCGGTVGDWQNRANAGALFWQDPPPFFSGYYPSYFEFPPNSNRVNWRMKFLSLDGTKTVIKLGTDNTDEFRVTSPGVIEFNSDLGLGRGDFWRFRITANECYARTNTPYSVYVDVYEPRGAGVVHSAAKLLPCGFTQCQESFNSDNPKNWEPGRIG